MGLEFNFIVLNVEDSHLMKSCLQSKFKFLSLTTKYKTLWVATCSSLCRPWLHFSLTVEILASDWSTWLASDWPQYQGSLTIFNQQRGNSSEYQHQIDTLTEIGAYTKWRSLTEVSVSEGLSFGWLEDHFMIALKTSCAFCTFNVQMNCLKLLFANCVTLCDLTWTCEHSAHSLRLDQKLYRDKPRKQ